MTVRQALSGGRPIGISPQPATLVPETASRPPAGSATPRSPPIVKCTDAECPSAPWCWRHLIPEAKAAGIARFDRAGLPACDCYVPKWMEDAE